MPHQVKRKQYFSRHEKSNLKKLEIKEISFFRSTKIETLDN